MGYTFISLLVLLCAAQLALCQDCATEEGQIEFVENGAQSNPDCYKPLLTLITGEGSFLPSQLSDICTKDCIGEVVDFLESTEECRNNEDNQDAVLFVESVLCGFRDGIDNFFSGCIFIDNYETVGFIVEACIDWWYPGIDNTCPHENCTRVLAEAEKEYGCCYNGLFGSNEFIRNATNVTAEILISFGTPPESIPDGFKVDITDDNLWKACRLSSPESCPDLTADFATIPVATPLIMMLFALLSKIIA